MRTATLAFICLATALPGTLGAQSRDTRTFDFTPTMGVRALELEVFTVAQGTVPVFATNPAGTAELGPGREFDRRTTVEDWSTLTRGPMEVRYHDDDDMDHFRDYFLLNGQQVFPGYPVTSVRIDADGRAWASLHAASSPDHRWRVGLKVYDPEGEFLFALESPSGETFHDAAGDRVVFVRDVRPETVEVVVRRCLPTGRTRGSSGSGRSSAQRLGPLVRGPARTPAQCIN